MPCLGKRSFTFVKKYKARFIMKSYKHHTSAFPINMLWKICLFLMVFWQSDLYAQLGKRKISFTRADTLRGTLSPARSSYDVYFYHLDITIDPVSKSIHGSNTIYFEVTENTHHLQVDLFENMHISRISLNGHKKLKFDREHNAVFIHLPQEATKGSRQFIKIYYDGKPIEAKRPPWDGGFVWSEDSDENPWIGVACQGAGASLWWPNKDHQSDEPDSMLISITAPEDLQNISNGRLRKVTKLKNGTRRFDWFVSYPINNYNVTVNIARYAHFKDQFISDEGDTLSLDYYVLPDKLEDAKKQFSQVQPMMKFFYEYFGPYPFTRDGYKLVHTPYVGMEHQSAVAYGNGFTNGYRGQSSCESGLKFDFIILHESAHEWWGNSITANDIADMWIHESFGSYAEGLYVECQYGYDEGMKYINSKRQNVRNDRPIIGPYGVNREGSGDMYAKGQLMLNTLRHVIGNDSLWFGILRGLNENFRHKSIAGQQLIDYINDKTPMDLQPIFDQYLKYTGLPQLNVTLRKKGKKVTATYRWKTDVKNFDMPVKVTTGPGKWAIIYPTTKSQTIDLHGLHPDNFQAAEDQFYIDVKIRKIYFVSD